MPIVQRRPVDGEDALEPVANAAPSESDLDPNQSIISGDVRVRNMPTAPSAAEGEATVAQYRRSTTDFVAPSGRHMGIGLGAGFGILPDRRFQAGYGAVKKVEENTENELRPFTEIENSPEERRKRALIAQAEAQKRFKQFTGTRSSPDDHFLLADLDYEKDSLLFGTDPMKFEENVNKLKKIIIEYEEWDKTDTYYKYATWAIKGLLGYIVLENFYLGRMKTALATSLDNFVQIVNEDIEEMDSRLKRDCERALREFETHAPDFSPVLAEIAKAKQAHDDARRDHPLDTGREARAEREIAEQEAKAELSKFFSSSRAEQKSTIWSILRAKPAAAPLQAPQLSDEELRQFTYAAAPTNIDAVRQARRFLLPRTDDFTQIVREEIAEYQRLKETSLIHPLAKLQGRAPAAAAQ